MIDVRKKIVLLACVLLMAAFPLFAQAITVDFDRTGSIVVHLEIAPNQKISGVTFALYRVGDVDNAYGGIDYHPNAEYAPSGVSFDFQTSSEALAAAETLKGYIAENNLPAQAVKTTDENGIASFTLRAVGVYFLDAAGGGPYGLAVSPLILSVPYFTSTDGGRSGTLDYDVFVYPKAEIVTTPTPTPSATPTPTPTPSPTPTATPTATATPTQTATATPTISPTPTPIVTLTPTPYLATTRPPTSTRYIDGQWVYVDENDVPLGVLPQTGDETSWLVIGLAIVLPLMAGAGAIWVIYRRKRRSSKK